MTRGTDSRTQVRRRILRAVALAVALTAAAVGLVLAISQASEQTLIPAPTALAAGTGAVCLLAVALYWIRRAAAAQTQLEQIQRRFRAMLDAAPTAVVMIDSTGRIALVNSGAESLFGYPREELLGQPVELLVPVRFRARHPGQRRSYLAAPAARPMGAGRDLFGLRKDGSEFPVEIGLNPLETDEGTFVLSAIVDITERKRAEAELVLLNNTLEQRVAGRTRQLQAALADLTRAKEVAEAASRAKSTFLANMSHEIRTPLNAVIGMTELVLETRLDDEQRSHLNLVRSAGESLLTVVNDILDFSKIEAGKLDLERLPFDHAELLGDTMKSLGFRAAAKGLELLCRIAPQVPTTLIGDAGRLRQVLVNLVGNAIKFTERGEIVVAVAVETVRPGEVVLHYTVRDTGIGIAREKLGSMFAPFEQADVSTTRRFGGTGLGLAISARLVQLMEGRIWAESEIGHGSTFHFTVRMGVSPQQPPAETDHLRDVPVLIVDDNATSRTVLTEMMRHWGLLPTAAAGGTEALSILRRARRAGQPVRLLILDAQMPDMDGYELARRVRQEMDLACPIILMLTPGDRPGDPAQSERLGILVCLTRPIKQSELFDALQLALGTRRGEPQHSPAPAGPAEQTPPGPSLSILLIDDSPVNQKLAAGVLTRAGHRVDVAANGREAVERWRRGSYDLLLMDVQMPEMDGLEATATIRAHEQQRGGHTPIIAMTAHALKGDRERCLAAGMDDYVAKPVRRPELFAAIQRVREQRAPSTPPVAAGEAPVDPAPAAAIDWPTVLETVSGDRQLLQELAETCLRETSELVSAMQTAIDSGDTALLTRAAHTLKSHMSVFGAAVAEHLAFHIENTARDGRSDVAGAFARLRQLTEQVQDELRAFLATVRQG